MRSRNTLGTFLAGAACGVIFAGIIALVWIWREFSPPRSANDQALYDWCLVQKGDTVACDAFLRVAARDRAKRQDQ
jgi:hypothetical protein